MGYNGSGGNHAINEWYPWKFPDHGLWSSQYINRLDSINLYHQQIPGVWNYSNLNVQKWKRSASTWRWDSCRKVHSLGMVIIITINSLLRVWCHPIILISNIYLNRDGFCIIFQTSGRAGNIAQISYYSCGSSYKYLLSVIHSPEKSPIWGYLPSGYLT
jgi:hypothetical protein